MEQFSFSYDRLPPSNNNYLKPTISRTGGKTYAYMYETKESKDFKKAFADGASKAPALGGDANKTPSQTDATKTAPVGVTTGQETAKQQSFVTLIPQPSGGVKLL